MLSCAGAYVSGAASSNECPAGSVRIATEAACRIAAAAAGMTAGSPFVGTSFGYPRGCYLYINIAYFNAHAVGAGTPYYQLLCAAVTTGATSLADMHMCAGTFTRAARWGGAVNACFGVWLGYRTTGNSQDRSCPAENWRICFLPCCLH